MLSYRLGTVNDFHWEFKPVLSYSKPYTFSTFLGEEKERKNEFNLSNHMTYLKYRYLFFLQNYLIPAQQGHPHLLRGFLTQEAHHLQSQLPPLHAHL